MHRLKVMKRAARRLGCVLAVGIILAVTANAYTVIMRGGRRVEIPAQFIVTAATLTYEVSRGVQITIAMAAIDIPATEKANNELQGSLLRRADSRAIDSQTSVDRKQSAVRTVATKAITNRDLEPSMRRRRDSELAYETRRKQLGLPSVAESQQQAAAEAEQIGVELEQKRAAEEESERYWRERATALRTEMATLDAEIAYTRARLDEGPLWPSSGWSSGWSNVAFSTVTSGFPFGNFGRRSVGNFGGRSAFNGVQPARPNIFVAPNAGARATGRFAVGAGATRAQVFLNPGTTRHARPGGVPFIGSRYPRYFPSGAISGWAFPDDYYYERGALVTRFNELGTARAGLSARWRELEDEARRAGMA